MSEYPLYDELSLEATKLNGRLWRNEIGLATYRAKDGRIYHVKYGIPGPGGSDMLGYTLVQITPQHVGLLLPVFTAAECKTKYKRARENQQDFLNAIAAAGGIAGVCRSVEDYRKLVGAL